MVRKDCDSISHTHGAARTPPPAQAMARMLGILLVVCVAAPQTLAGNVRLWPSAVVVDETVRLSDLCEITGLESGAERELNSLVIIAAPPVGGSRVIHIDMIRSALTQAGTNMAKVTLCGATQCAVSRPSNVAPPSSDTTERPPPNIVNATKPGGRKPSAAPPPDTHTLTLRRAVEDHFSSEFARYGGTAEVIFDRTSDQVLDLAGPLYAFKVRRRGGSPLGLTSLEVDVTTNGRVVQTVPMVVQVSMLGRTVVARRAINQGATIRAADVTLVSMSVTRLDKLGFADVALVIGQRAKRFVPTGTLIEPAVLESVPLVRRGDYVKLTTVVGAVRVVTAGRATADGVLGDVITVRAADNKRVEFDAVVVGLGAVHIGTDLPRRLRTTVALGGQKR